MAKKLCTDYFNTHKECLFANTCRYLHEEDRCISELYLAKLNRVPA